ncbi:pyruvate,water dikinase [Stackebrandtia endophytica]|uniref:Pyruvate,water dikinase n=1 Tax=Stackebrandtia endophytica TaxID=1496996 RepID=A0A543AS77_9ACTN|nr:PEP/pyruvate-binding domain-containing protein [Stackebrandtia endophytica]TQL75428.1 pyruvate,water dikinase [Stackebrandtia endophytica]
MLVDLPDATDPAEVGGKAANLGRILRAGMDVPDGFVITGDVHRLAEAIEPRGDVELLEAAIPRTWRNRIIEAVDRIGVPVAVRSSGVDEDGGRASFAGQFQSYLSRQTGDQVLRSVAGCWHSASAASAREYRGDATATAMPVLVQRMVPADYAGVMFTQDPVTGDPSQLVIEAVSGLGDALCDGRVDPDRYRIDKVTGGLRSIDRAAGVTLTPVVLSRLRDLAVRLERLFAAPQDIEWAVVGDQVWILQSRPITVTMTPTGTAPSLIDMSAVFAASLTGRVDVTVSR